MPDRYHALRSALIAALLPAVFAGKMDPKRAAVTERTLEAIKECMAGSPAPWPDVWRREYIDTIRSAVWLHGDSSQYAARLEILRKGFALYWESFKKTNERSLFELEQARIRWYTEHLMATDLPRGDEKRKLRDQFTEIWDYAANSLLQQFPFLDPNAVDAAKADHLSQCHQRVEAPLLPIYMHPFSKAQVEQIKQRWHDLRYARVDLWRSLGAGSALAEPNPERDYRLTQKSLSQLLGLVWTVVPQRPDYYLSALENRTKVLKQRVKSKRQARSAQQRMEKARSRQLLQTEHISFLLAALLETPLCLDGSASASAQDQTASEQRDKTVKGGGAYEVEQGSRQK